VSSFCHDKLSSFQTCSSKRTRTAQRCLFFSRPRIDSLSRLELPFIFFIGAIDLNAKLKGAGKAMRRSFRICVPVVMFVSAIFVTVHRVSAHHGWSGYDSSKVLELKGTIVESGYEHPHGFVRLKASDKTWVVVLAPPSRMEGRQLPRKNLASGTEAVVVGYPSRTDPQEMRAERITINGRTTELR